MQPTLYSVDQDQLYLIKGQTFIYKDTLKRYGALWDHELKGWLFDEKKSISEHDIDVEDVMCLIFGDDGWKRGLKMIQTAIPSGTCQL
jgi:hypothetical protein